jgi:hypothetical protein
MPDAVMKNNTSALLDHLDESLWDLRCEMRLADSLVGDSSQTLEIDANVMATIVRRLAEQIETARDIAQQLRKATG